MTAYPQRTSPSLETTRCDLCAANDAEELMRAPDLRCGDGVFSVVRCRQCSLVYVNPRPDRESLAAYYPSQSAQLPVTDQRGSAFGRGLRDVAFGRPIPLGGAFAWLYNSTAFRALARTGRRGRVLDVGCGGGSYLQQWLALDWSVEGLEIDPTAAARATDLLNAPVHVGFAEELELPRARFDLVTMSHSLEHMRSPSLVLQRITHWLRPGGLLLVMVPNFAALDRRVFGQRWYGLEVPRHLYHFEPRTLRDMLERAGFVVDQLGGSAHPAVVLKHARALVGRRVEPAFSGLARLAATALLLPLAALRRSTSLWAIARLTSSR